MNSLRIVSRFSSLVGSSAPVQSTGYRYFAIKATAKSRTDTSKTAFPAFLGDDAAASIYQQASSKRMYLTDPDAEVILTAQQREEITQEVIKLYNKQEYPLLTDEEIRQQLVISEKYKVQEILDWSKALQLK
eukprot:CAMPEP_0184699688 /NCGR_PEP_ID=MMETSP0313-20130426/5868_1 /TAXON_ID=2792 /ORGANISM="Porphyridium aerugineum, Strain SAG 1380-2" /LENGTH=131 /DNA_ID=CAMNT_0027158811 /DNA_START=159 /DNA_END=554 /DNA_ORIENTATION=+